MTRRQFLGSVGALGATAAAPRAFAQAAGYPSKPIKILVPFNAGSGADSYSRFFGELMSRTLGQPIVVENRPGASGLIAMQALRQAPPDGHTLIVGTTSPMCVMPVLVKNLPYDAFKDVKPIHGFAWGPATFVVKADSPFKTLADVAAAAKRDRKSINVGNYSDGYMLLATWLGLTLGVPVNHVPYKGGTQMQTDLIGGSLDLGVNDFSGVADHIRGGRLRALAITDAKRHPMFPDIPTMKDLGYADFESYVFASLYTDGRVPDDIANKLADSLRAAMLSPEGKNFLNTMTGTPMMMHTKELGDFQRKEYERFKKVADLAGIQAK
ncbi:MAG TPA: tripartite tricarboxylate transporter substrate binding protein [Burkholderiaceae bacterium]|jgi:tripartite-type tricarboxylate transporter receptor subunit TctC|nr:tripartite tricarboxylate transporter substrate binding protein [Burkholderiaceae bacterium]